MESVTVSRTLAADPERVREAMRDLEPFMKAAGFDTVAVEGRDIEVANAVGVATIELSLRLRDDPEVDLAYEQTDGIFEEMWTSYTVTPVADGTEVTATTEFALDVAIVGGVLDSTIIKRQRRRELDAQFDWLESVVRD